MEVWRVERFEAFSIIARSIIVIKGVTRPEAQVAAVKSVVMRQGRWSVFQLWVGRGFAAIGAGCGGLARMMFGGAVFSPIGLARPFPSNSRVILCNTPGRQT